MGIAMIREQIVDYRFQLILGKKLLFDIICDSFAGEKSNKIKLIKGNAFGINGPNSNSFKSKISVLQNKDLFCRIF